MLPDLYTILVINDCRNIKTFFLLKFVYGLHGPKLVNYVWLEQYCTIIVMVLPYPFEATVCVHAIYGDLLRTHFEMTFLSQNMVFYRKSYFAIFQTMVDLQNRILNYRKMRC